MLNMPKGKVQRGGVPKWKCVRMTAPESKQITSRPSLTSFSPSVGRCTSTPHMKSNIGPFSDTFNYYSLTYNYSQYPFGGSVAGSSNKHGTTPTWHPRKLIVLH